MIIAIDFDGTIAKTFYPEIIEPIPGAIRTILDLSINHKLILNTLRELENLDMAMEWLTNQKIFHCFSEVNNNLETQIKLWGNNPRKIAADIYIDDRSIGWNGWHDVRKYFCLD